MLFLLLLTLFHSNYRVPQPVDVGDLLVFKSLILYTSPDGRDLGSYVDGHKGMPLVAVEVACWVTCGLLACLQARVVGDLLGGLSA